MTAPLIALAIPLLAYGLTAFWLSPSYLRITLHNMQYVSERGSPWSAAAAVAVLAAVGLAVAIYVLLKLFDKRPDAGFPIEQPAAGEAAIETEDEDSTLIT